MVPFEEMPCCIDPAGGTIVTANNRVMENGKRYLSTDSMPPHRARRIWQRLAQLSKAGVDDMASVHRDLVSVVPTIKDGIVLAPTAPGLGTALNPDVRRRDDATVRESGKPA